MTRNIHDGYPTVAPGHHVEARLAAFYFVFFSYLSTFSTYFPLWLAQRQYSPTEIAVVFALPQLLRIVVPLAWAHLAERYGSRGILAVSSALAVVVCLALAPSSAFAEVLLLVGLLGVFTTGVLPLVEATTIAALAGRPERFGPVRLWGSIGTIATLIGVGLLLDVQPIAILIPVMTALLALMVVASFAIPARRLVSPDAISKDWGHALKRPAVIAFLASCFCMMMAHGALFTFFTLHLAAHGYSKSMVGLLWGLSFLAEIAGLASLPWLFRRCSYRTVILIGFAAGIVRFIATGWGASSLAVMILAQLLHALTFSIYHAASVVIVQRLFPGDLGMRGQALYSGSAFGLGGVCGGLLAGWAWQIAGPEIAFTLAAFFCVIGGAIVLLRLPESAVSVDEY